MPQLQHAETAPARWRLARRALPLLLLAPRPGRAAPNDMVDALVATVRRGTDNDALTAVRETMDLPFQTRFAAGRYQRNLSPGQFARLQRIVEAALVVGLQRRFPRNQEVTRATRQPRTDERTGYFLYVRANDGPTAVTFVMNDSPAGPRIADWSSYDAGSILVTLREEIQGLIAAANNDPEQALSGFEARIRRAR